MKFISSLLCRHDYLHYISNLYIKNTHALASVVVRKYGTKSNSDTPKNMFELYSKNSNWLEVYERHPLKKEPVTQTHVKETLEREKEKNIPPDLRSVIDEKNAVWTEKSRRVGAIGIKLGLSSMWTKEGYRHVVTLVQIKDCHVIDAQISREDGGTDLKTQLILGTHELTDEKVLASLSYEKMQWYNHRGVAPQRFWARFAVTKDALLMPGTEITASHFMPGQAVVVAGITRKRGFQGVMKRWGMKGQPASHGQTKTHRKMGATGGGTDPGRIFPGKRMAGHVGGKWRSTQPLKVFRINSKLNVLFIKGIIPGDVNNHVLINDAGFPREAPFPTYYKDGADVAEDDLYADNVARFTDPSLEFPPFKI